MDDRYRVIYEYLNLRNLGGDTLRITIAGENHGLSISQNYSDNILFLELDNDGKLRLYVTDESIIV